jgi:hypothetical protein
MTAPLLPTDGCPRCIAADPVHPYQVEFSRPGSQNIVAAYRCPVCAHYWWTGWDASAADLPCPGCPECGTDRGAVA